MTLEDIVADLVRQKITLDEINQAMLKRAVVYHINFTRAAKRLGITPKTLYKRLRKVGITPESVREEKRRQMQFKSRV